MDDLPSVETTVSGRCLVATVRGAMDYATQPELRQRLKHVITHSERAVVLELTDVSFCDSAGLSVLLGARREAEKAAVVLVLACVPVPLRQILQMTRADQVLPTFDTVADAEAALSS
ncbi:anti-anti-sigma factor [Streptomyces puniciscabiei]|uniref:Anti-sigma factor antagonist n=1 Tax=Streptomyces puniciscabiei TaxID=164348 RepID=A0A542UIX9_9ACTN|nr:STAS domain-containing protein [Streptomyces puniciscabiei]TQK99030.1 anti-anti-sigma factor [Streptomyces puniciscabiei]